MEESGCTCTQYTAKTPVFVDVSVRYPLTFHHLIQCFTARLQLNLQLAHIPFAKTRTRTWEQVFRSTKLVHDEVRWRGGAHRGLAHVAIVDAADRELLDELGRELSLDGVCHQAADDRQELVEENRMDEISTSKLPKEQACWRDPSDEKAWGRTLNAWPLPPVASTRFGTSGCAPMSQLSSGESVYLGAGLYR